ncbi:hypothetical protein [Azospirillum himalayense]|uniref:Uncharacterized protein n=1 Tax=Azospirillum himalayense TaxID=654847 RepID=A0ABW0GCY0_9PROT
MRVLATALLSAALFSLPATAADQPKYGSRVQTNGTGFACEDLSALREAEAARSAKDDNWLGAIGECVYLRDGVNAAVVGSDGDYVHIRAIMPNGAGSRYWVGKSSLKAPCFVGSGCK